MYAEEGRTFIHTGKENEEWLIKLKCGENLRITNKENENEFIIQKFSFVWSFKEVERFIFLTFLWERGDGLYWKRHSNAGKINKDINQPVFVLSETQRLLYSLMSAYSSFFFITDDFLSDCCYFITENFNSFERENKLTEEEEYIASLGEKKRYWVVLDRLGIKTVNEKIIYVYSLFPFDLLYI